MLDAQSSRVYASGEAGDSRISGEGGETAKITEWTYDLDELVEEIKNIRLEKFRRVTNNGKERGELAICDWFGSRVEKCSI